MKLSKVNIKLCSLKIVKSVFGVKFYRYGCNVKFILKHVSLLRRVKKYFIVGVS